MRFRLLKGVGWNRVQAIFTGIGDEVYYAVRVKLPENMRQLLSAPGTMDKTLQEKTLP